ncbi:MAG TPA: hypothetical protein VNF46_05370 [Gammaproteobacteria bacterium]|nr:hypothetical protein [Gammaproteobacteria bacterium]
MKSKTSLTPDAASRRYKYHVFMAMGLYIMVLFVCIHYLKTTPPGALRIVLALLPTLPVTWVMWSLFMFLTRADELQRRVHLESLALAAGVTAFLSLTYGFLEDFAGLPHIPAWWTFVVIDIVWGATGCVLWRRYR